MKGVFGIIFMDNNSNRSISFILLPPGILSHPGLFSNQEFEGKNDEIRCIGRRLVLLSGSRRRKTPYTRGIVALGGFSATAPGSPEKG
jgi:hypothetical protein